MQALTLLQLAKKLRLQEKVKHVSDVVYILCREPKLGASLVLLSISPINWPRLKNKNEDVLFTTSSKSPQKILLYLSMHRKFKGAQILIFPSYREAWMMP